MGGAATLAALILMIALLPAVQRWAVLTIAGGHPGLKLDVERLAIRPGSVEIHNLRAEKAGMLVVLPDATFEVSLWQALAHRRLVLRDARVNGLKVDLTAVASSRSVAGGVMKPALDGGFVANSGLQTAAGPRSDSPSAGEAPAGPFFDGVFKHLQLPCEVVLDSCRIEVEVLIPRTASPPTEARVTLSGGHFGPGQEARFDFEAAIRHPGPGSPVEAIDGRGVLTATLSTPTAIERLRVHFDAGATGPVLPLPARMLGDLLLARNSTGETYSLTLDSFEAGTINRLLALDCDYVAGSSRLTGSWHVQANNREVAPFALGISLPDFSLAGDGRFEANSATLDVSLAGQLTGDANRLEIVDPRLRQLGTLGVAAAFNVEFSRGELRITEFGVDINGPSPELSLHAVQPFTVNLKTGETTAADAKHELIRITLDGVPAAWAQPLFPDIAVSGGEVNGELIAVLHGGGRMWLRTAAPLVVRGLTGAQIAGAGLPAADLKLDAEVEYAAGETRVRVTGLEMTTPAGDRFDGRGELALRPGENSPQITVQADFDASLPTLFEGYVPVGGLTAKGVVVLSRSDEVMQVDRIEVRVLAGDGRSLFDLSSPEAFRIDFVRRQLQTVEGGPGEILRLGCGRMPLRIARAGPGGLQIRAELGAGRGVVQTDASGFKVSTVEPLRLENLSVRVGDRDWLKEVAMEFKPTLAYTPQGTAIELAGLRVKNAAGDNILSAQASVTAGVKLDNPKCQGTTSFDLALAAMTGQPFLRGVEPPRQGRLTGDVKFALDENLLGEGRLTLNNLVSAVNGEPLPVANISFRAGLNGKGEIAFQTPILIDRAGERSDLTLGATLRPAPGGRTIDARLTSTHLVVDDLLLMARALPTASVPPFNGSGRVAPTEPAPVAPAAAFWAGVVGLVQLDLRSVVYGRCPEIVGLKGRAMIEPQRLAAENVGATLGKDGSQVRLSGEVRFAAGEPRPYKSKLDLEVKGFEVGTLFKLVDPEKPPTIEGRFDARIRAEGAGPSLVDLAASTDGKLVLQSRKGVSRLLQRLPPAPPKSSGIVSSVANTAVRVIDNIGEKVGKIVSYTDSTDEIAALLAEVQFDQLNVHLSRDRALNTHLAEFSLVSPVIRLRGEGLVTADAGKSLFSQPLKLTLSMAVMGTVEKAMTEAKAPMLSTERDDLGYLKSTEVFEVAGTLDKPDPGQLYTMVARSMIGKLLH